MVTPEEFLRVYKEVCLVEEPNLELMDFVRNVALTLVLDKTSLYLQLKAVIGGSDAMRLAEETYLHAIIETVMRCMKGEDLFFEKLEKEMKDA